MKWQPIETAPIADFDAAKWFVAHSPRLLLWSGQHAYIGTYGYTERGKGRWLNSNGHVCLPTHWMPLPEPPK